MSTQDKQEKIKGRFDPILKTITDDDIRTFLDEVQGTQKCWFCGKNSLHPLAAQQRNPETGEMVPSEGLPAFFAMPIQSDIDEDFEIRVPAFSISCSSCGHTLSMSAIPLMNWKRGRDDG